MAQTYLSNLHMERFVSEFEKNPSHETMEVMVSALLCYAFDSDEKWAMKYKRDPTCGGSFYFAMALNGNSKTLHAIIKVVSTSEPVSEDWDLPVTPLAQAPLPNERCWAILFQGMSMKLFEYHRDQPVGARLLVCDFKVDGKTTDTLNIRTDCRVVNSVLFQIPEQHPLPLSDAFLKLQAKALAIKAVDDKAAESNVDDQTSEVESEGEKIAVEAQSLNSEPAGVKPTAVSFGANIQPKVMPKVHSAQPTAMPAVKPAVNPAFKPAAIPVVRPTASPIVKPATSPAFKTGAYFNFKPTASPFQPGAHTTLKSGLCKPAASPAVKASTVPKGQPAVKPVIKPNTQPKVKAAASSASAVDLMTFADLDIGSESKVNGRAAPAKSLI
jgi:hypothetical protein